MSVSENASEPKGSWGREKDVQTRLNSGMKKGDRESGGGSPGRTTNPGPGFCIILILTMKPFQGSERESDFPKVTQLEASCLPVSFT